jgi:hypothetical protein
MRKTGRRIKATRVIFQERNNIATRTSRTLTKLLTTEDRMSVNACCAPRTSLFRRETSAPVWVRVKKAIGMS